MTSTKTPLESLLDYLQPQPFIVRSEHYSDDFKTAVLTAGKTFILGRTDEQDGIYQASPDKPIILFDDFTTACQWVDFPFKVKSSACKILVPKAGINPKYVFYAMKAINFDATSHKRYWIGTYSSKEIKVPERADQDKIALELSTIQKSISRLSDSIQHCDELVISNFEHTFSVFKQGDCKSTVSNYAEVFQGYAFKSKGFLNLGCPVIRINNISNNSVNLDNALCFPMSFFQLHPQFRAQRFDVLMAMSGATTGKAGIFDSNANALVNQRVAIIRPKNFESAFFLQTLFQLDWMSKLIQTASPGSAQPNISGKQIENLPAPLASRNEISLFNSKASSISSLKRSLSREKELLTELLNLKMRQYFD